MKLINKLWIWIIVLIVLSPLGLLIPDHFKAGAAWGEWGTDEIQKMAGYMPRGLGHLSAFWKAPAADYSFHGLGSFSGYMCSAVIGVILAAGIVYFIGTILTKDKAKM